MTETPDRTMVERVARAMAAADSGPDGSMLFDIHWSEFGPGYLKNARAAIQEMREPTEAMTLSGMIGKVVKSTEIDGPIPSLSTDAPPTLEKCADYHLRVANQSIGDQEIKAAWQAMIDAALSEGQ